MVQHCCVTGCNNKWTPNAKVRFHNFPIKRPDILKLWLEALGLDAPGPNSVVCSEHFTPNNYSSNKMTLLKKDAVPSKLIRRNNEQRNTIIKSGSLGERTQTESSIGEEVDHMNQPIIIKEEIEKDIGGIKEQEERRDEFEFISLDTIADTSRVSEPIYRKYKNKSANPVTERLEDEDLSATYCEMCDIQFDRKEQFDEHYDLHKKKSTYFCSVCLEVYKTRQIIVKHFAKHQKIELLSKCNLCNFTFGSKDDLDMHLMTFKDIHFHTKNTVKNFP